MTPKETLIRMFAKLDPPTTELAINLAIGQGFSDDEILAMRPKCYEAGRNRWCHGIATSIGTHEFGTVFSNVGKPVCDNCELPF